MTLTCNAPTADRALPATVQIGLMAHPWSADKITQTLTFHASVQSPSRKLTAAPEDAPPQS